MQTQASPQNPGDSQKHNPDWLISTLALSETQRGSGCVPFPTKQQLDGAQAAFDREPSHCSQQIPDLRDQGILYCPLVWTADGRPHPAVSRTLQHAADVASSRNGQQMLAKSLQHRWKHEIQMGLLRWRPAMTRAVLPNPSAVWLLAGIIDRALSHWAWALPLGGRDDDGDADTGTDTTTPDDFLSFDPLRPMSVQKTVNTQQRNSPACLSRQTGQHAENHKEPSSKEKHVRLFSVCEQTTVPTRANRQDESSRPTSIRPPPKTCSFAFCFTSQHCRPRQTTASFPLALSPVRAVQLVGSTASLPPPDAE